MAANPSQRFDVAAVHAFRADLKTLLDAKERLSWQREVIQSRLLMALDGLANAEQARALARELVECGEALDLKTHAVLVLLDRWAHRLGACKGLE